jgi:NADH dehydrogenase
VDLDGRRVVLSDGGAIPYDSLVVATGARHSYFGHDAWQPFAPGLKTIEDATEIRRRILIAFEAAEREADPTRRSEWMTFVVVGGGPPGHQGYRSLVPPRSVRADREVLDADQSPIRVPV